LKGDGGDAFGEGMAEIYDSWYGTQLANETRQDAVELLTDLAAGGAVLELAIGTGRLSLPLAERGLSVQGIDASEAMVAKLREKPGGEAIPVKIGDLVDVGVDGVFDLIFLAFNTLFNVTSQEGQVRCFQNVAQHLSAEGVFVVEAYVPDNSAFVNEHALRTAHVTTDSVYLEASVHDPIAQTVLYQYIEITRAGTRLYPIPSRYAWPSELDLMARLAGLTLRERWAGWDRSPFTASSAKHVSVYARQ
jgi:SAM-dependent methyltransferase